MTCNICVFEHMRHAFVIRPGQREKTSKKRGFKHRKTAPSLVEYWPLIEYSKQSMYCISTIMSVSEVLAVNLTTRIRIQQALSYQGNVLSDSAHTGALALNSPKMAEHQACWWGCIPPSGCHL